MFLVLILKREKKKILKIYFNFSKICQHIPDNINVFMSVFSSDMLTSKTDFLNQEFFKKWLTLP